MWSVGCILVEMIQRKPFLHGNSTTQQLNLIIDMLGTPTKEEVQYISNKNIHELKIFKNKKVEGKNFSNMFPSVGDSAIDLIKQLLTFDPKTRITAAQALKHPYL